MTETSSRVVLIPAGILLCLPCALLVGCSGTDGNGRSGTGTHPDRELMLEQYEVLDDKVAGDPENPDAYNTRGTLSYRLQRYMEAEEDFARAVELDPAYFEAWFNLGLAREAQEKKEAAIEAYCAALKIYPELLAALLNRGALFLQLGALRSARTDFELAARIAPDDPRPLFNLALQQREAGERNEAVRTLRRVLELEPAHADAQALLQEWGGRSE